MKILTAQQMREIDRLTVERAGISYPTLMETAGSRVVEAIISHYGSVMERCCLIFCGKGNNGGDGAVAARLLWLQGARVAVYLFGKIAETKGEARANFESIRRLAEAYKVADEGRIDFLEITSGDELEWEKILHLLGSRSQAKPAQSAEGRHGRKSCSLPFLVIDALLGTGLTRPAEGLYAKAVELINHLKAEDPASVQVISVDIPSGLSSDSGHPIGPHVCADLTVSFTAPKIGNLLPPAGYANGKLVVAPIGTPDWLLAEESGSHLNLVEEKQVARWLRETQRAPDVHKGSLGDVLLIAGSRGKTGAATLASEAVLRAGAGLVTVATARSAQPLLVSQARPEVMTEALEETSSGAISQTATEAALQLAQKRTVLAIGPGLSSSDESTRQFVHQIVRQRKAPMIIDADGLNALAPWPAELRGAEGLPLIVTPHPGEMARLVSKSNAEVVADGAGIAREFAVKHNLIVVLKGSRTLIAAPDGELYVNPTGNAGMATAGSGDVLTGLVAGLLAQQPQNPLQAVIAAVYLHGLAGDIAARRLGMRSLLASDITGHLSEAILCTGGANEGTVANWIGIWRDR